jgi:Flp pilus assembly protein TadD
MMGERGRWSLVSLGALLAALVGGCGGGPAQAEDPSGSSAEMEFSDLESGKASLEEGKFAEARASFEKALAKSPGSAEATFYLGVSKEKLGDKAGAEQAYKDALQKDPNLADAAANLTALYLEDPPRPDEAIKILKPALAKAPKDTALMTNLAYAYTLKNDVENASKQFEAIIAAGAAGADVRLAYGQVLLDAKQTEKAVEQFKKGVEAADKDVKTIVTLGLLLRQAEAFGDCVKALDKAIALKGDQPETFVRRGICRHDLKDEPGARADFEAAIKLNPDLAPAHYYLGVSWLSEKNYPAARAELTKASTLAGESDLGKRAREKLNEVPKK